MARGGCFCLGLGEGCGWACSSPAQIRQVAAGSERLEAAALGSVSPTLPIAVLQPFVATGGVVLRDGGDHGQMSYVLPEIICVIMEKLPQDDWWP